MKISLKKRIALNFYKKYKQNETKLHELSYLFWEITLRCNLNCLHCGSDCKIDTRVKDMPLNDFLKVLDDIAPTVNPNKTMIVITGGEPLLRKDLEECGSEFNKRGFPWGMVTNGYFLTEQRFKQLYNSGLTSITVSLDGLKEEHDFFRGHKGSFERAYKAIKIVGETPELMSDVVTSVTRYNIHQLNEIKELLINAKIKRWRLFTITPIGRAKNNEKLFLSNSQFRELFDFISATRKEGKIKASYGCEGFLGKYEGEVRDDFFFCRAGINIGSVLADGSISACPNLRENFSQGNIYKDNFVDVWENKFQIMRDRSWTKTGDCANCEVYKWCEGNGLHLRNETTGELYVCHYQKVNSKNS